MHNNGATVAISYSQGGINHQANAYWTGCRLRIEKKYIPLKVQGWRWIEIVDLFSSVAQGISEPVRWTCLDYQYL